MYNRPQKKLADLDSLHLAGENLSSDPSSIRLNIKGNTNHRDEGKHI